MSRIKLYSWLVVAIAVTSLVWLLFVQGTEFPSAPIFAFWVFILLIAEMLPVTLGFQTRITMGYPVLLATAILYQPAVTMLIAGVGSLDIRELRREIPFHRALFNRSQTMLAIGVASVIFRASGEPFHPLTIVAAAGADLIINLGLVSGAVHLERGIALREVIRHIPPSPFGGFLLSYGLLTALGAATAVAYREGIWVVVAILVPLLFARMAIQGARSREELSERIQRQQEALLRATETVLQEREEERGRIAAHIHDTSLQMLAAASYGSSNVTKLLRSGDVATALDSSETVREALDEAMASLRESLVDLRRSAIEAGGLAETVEHFTEQLSTVWGADIDVDQHLESEPPISVALAAFQIIQEALVNALKHSDGASIRVAVQQNDAVVTVSVEDDGTGFDPTEDPGAEHVGMRLMKERAEGVGGNVEIRSAPGSGTSIRATLPAGIGA